MNQFVFNALQGSKCRYCKLIKDKHTHMDSVYHNQYVRKTVDVEGFGCTLREKPKAEDLEGFDEPCTTFLQAICAVAQDKNRKVMWK